MPLRPQRSKSRAADFGLDKSGLQSRIRASRPAGRVPRATTSKTRVKQVLLACRVESFSPGDGERLRILRPATGVRQMSFKDLKKNYTPISAEDVRVLAEIHGAFTPTTCLDPD